MFVPLIKSCDNGKLGKKGSCRVFSLTQVVLQVCEVVGGLIFFEMSKSGALE